MVDCSIGLQVYSDRSLAIRSFFDINFAKKLAYRTAAELEIANRGRSLLLRVEKIGVVFNSPPLWAVTKTSRLETRHGCYEDA